MKLRTDRLHTGSNNNIASGLISQRFLEVCLRVPRAKPIAWAAALPLLLALHGPQAALAQTPEAATPPATAELAPNSALDAPLFYQLLVGEMEAQAGRQANAFDILLDAARRARDGAVFQRVIELAVQGRSGERALAAAKAWRLTLPESSEALRTEVQLLVALDKLEEVATPLRLLIERAQEVDRSSIIAGLPRFLAGAKDKAKALEVSEKALAGFINASSTRTAARTALGRLALTANDAPKAKRWMLQAHADDPAAAGPVLLALDLMAADPTAEATVSRYLEQPDALPAIRLAYVQALDQQQRLGDAVAQLRLALISQPEAAQAWLTLGAYLVDLQEPKQAIEAIKRYQALPAPSDEANPSGPAEQDDREDRALMRRDYAWLLLAQAHDQLGQTSQALAALDQIDSARADLSVLTRRGILMTRQGQLEAAKTLVREAPARGNASARNRLMAEAVLLREAKQWQQAYDLLLSGVRADPDDSGLIYELAMVAERMARYEDMEVLLRRVMVLAPEEAHAYNALGYSLAERNVRLDEAAALVRRASELSPKDPFITDSLGWVAFRQGDLETALRLLTQSNTARPHVEVAAHLGEVLWALGRKEDALRVWREGRAHEAGNEVLRETLLRLKVAL